MLRQMRCLAHLAFVSFLALVPLLACLVACLVGCGGAAPLATPPVVVIPVEPVGPVSKSAPAASTPEEPPVPPPPWVQRAKRSEKTKRVAACQIVPFAIDSSIAVENRFLGDGRVSVRVIEDVESAKGVAALPGLLGKGYVAERTPTGIHVHGEDGMPVPDDQVARVRSLAAATIAWPGHDVVSSLPAAGGEVTALEGPVVAVAAVPLHGEMANVDAKATVHFVGPQKSDDRDALAFDVTVSATESDAGMCHRWTNAADLKGELLLDARDGDLLSLHLTGPTHDTEGLCQGQNGGPPAPPHTCNQGDVAIDVTQPHVP
jgi:hypothetical protein